MIKQGEGGEGGGGRGEGGGREGGGERGEGGEREVPESCSRSNHACQNWIRGGGTRGRGSG